MRLDQYSTAPTMPTYKDYLRKQAQDDLKQLDVTASSASPLVQPAPKQPQATDLNVLQQYQATHGAGTPQGTVLSTPGLITQAFGNRNPVEQFSGGINYGTDFGVPEGTKVALPPGKWVAVEAFDGEKNDTGHLGNGTNRGYGNSVLFQNLQTGEKLRFSHLSQGHGIQPGEVLPGGTTFGQTGLTGNTSGPHLDLEYYDPSGKLNDVMHSQYAQFLTGQLSHGAGGEGGGNPFADFGNMVLNAGKSFVSNLDPANESTPILGPIRKFNRENLGAEDTRNMTPEQKVMHALTQYSQTFMGGHGDSGIASDATLPTTKILNQIQNSKVLPKQHITSLLNQDGVKQAEKDVLTQALQNYGDKVPVEDFSNSVRNNLLPLDRLGSDSLPFGGMEEGGRRYESINLPINERGATTNYSENIYNSPINTQAGSVHFPDRASGYFGHTRTEDLYPSDSLDNYNIAPNPNGDGYMALHKDTGDVKTYAPSIDSLKEYFNFPDFSGTPHTRRILEVQSDLFQKGRLDREFEDSMERNTLGDRVIKEYNQMQDKTGKKGMGLLSEAEKKVDMQYNQLKPYENTWQERLVREEMKKAAEDGIKNLQFPTGDTAMKIEGLGPSDEWADFNHNSHLEPGDLEVGKLIGKADPEQGLYNEDGDAWVVTHVLGNGKFKAVNQLGIENDYPAYRYAMDHGYVDKETGEWDLNKAVKDPGFLKVLAKSDMAEQFDVSNKPDPNHPIHKFYESELAKYLKKFKAEKITDDRGNTWNQIKVDPSLAKKSVEAFALLPLLGIGGVQALQQYQQSQQKQQGM